MSPRPESRLALRAGVRRLVEAERARGRRVVLATASHRTLAEKVAAHLGLFGARGRTRDRHPARLRRDPDDSRLALPAALVVEPDAVARRIVARIEGGADVAYAPAFWAIVMAVVRSIPGPAFKRLRL